MIVCAEHESEINPRNKKYVGTKDVRRFQEEDSNINLIVLIVVCC